MQLNDNFWRWFGKSKMVDKQGNPLVFYHVTNSDFNTFKPCAWNKKQGFVPDEENGRRQFYFTKHKDWATNFAKKEFSRKQKKNQRLLEVYLKVENPLVIHTIQAHDMNWWLDYLNKYINISKEELTKMAYYNKGAHFMDMPQLTWEIIFNDTHILADKCKEAGYDGVIIGDTKRDNLYSASVIVFDSNQIKSINNEKFSNSDNIYETLNEQLAYHGSREKFDKFDLNKFQRGDYGYGIYFTRSKGYAGNYGTVKEYEIPDNEYLLSWEDTWQYQSEYVYNCLDKLFDDLYDNDRDAWEKIINIVDRGYGNDGEGLYMNLSEILKLSSKQTSELLYKYGIKGIDSFKGNCQVIFNPEDIKMLVTEELNNKYIAYHGSQSNNLILEEKPIYLVTDKEEAIEWAKGYAFNYDLFKEDKPTLYTIEVTLNNPKILQTEDDYYDYMEITSREWFIPELTKDGYDGCIYENYYMPLNAKKQCKIIDKQEFPNNRVYMESFKSLNEQLQKYI